MPLRGTDGQFDYHALDHGGLHTPQTPVSAPYRNASPAGDVKMNRRPYS